MHECNQIVGLCNGKARCIEVLKKLFTFYFPATEEKEEEKKEEAKPEPEPEDDSDEDFGLSLFDQHLLYFSSALVTVTVL